MSRSDVSIGLCEVVCHFEESLRDAAREKAGISAEEKTHMAIDLKGAIITIDAMGTQTAIAEQIVEGKGDFILALKANQDSLFQQVMNYVDEHIRDDFAGVPSERLEEETKKGHGRSLRILPGSDASLCLC